MGKIVIYKGISNKYETRYGNGKIKTILPDYDTKNTVFLVGGKTVTTDYDIKDDDIVYVRVVPGATVIAVVAVAVACVAVGAAAYSAYKQQQMQKEMEEQQRKAREQAKALSESLTQLPFLKGATNKSALGYNIPFVMGQMYQVPYLLTTGFYSISGANGANQFWNASLVTGYKNVLIQSISIGSTKIKVGTSTATGNVKYLPDNAVYAFDSGVYYDSNNCIELRSNGELVTAGLSSKVSSTAYSDTIPHKHGDSTEWVQGVVKQLATNTYKVDVCISFEGLRVYDDGWKSKAVTVTVYWSNNTNASSPTWHNAGTINTGSQNSNKTLRFQKTINFSAADCYNKDISIKLVRETTEASTNSQETCYLNYINCWQYDAYKSSASEIVPCLPLEQPWRDKTQRIGLRIISNDSTKDQLDEINIMSYGLARIWDGESWNNDKQPTRNPAAWALEILTSDVHQHSQYADEEIDLESFGAWFEYCDDNELYCDGLITEDQKKQDILQNILNENSATMFINAQGKWEIAIEQKQDTPVALLNEQSIKSITVTKSFARTAYAQKITYTDRDTWKINSAYLSQDGDTSSQVIYDKEKVITENNAKYITTAKHAFKYARRMMAKQKLQPREIAIQTGREGDYYPLYGKVLVQLRQLRIGLSNGIIHNVGLENNKILGLEVSDLCDFTDTTKRYGIIIQAQNDTGHELIYAEVIGTGKTHILQLLTPQSYTTLPEYGNQYSFGYLDDNGEFVSITNPMMIYGIKPNENGFELTVKDYNESIFDDGDIPEYKSNLTPDPENRGDRPVTITELNRALSEVNSNVIGGDNVGNPDVPVISSAKATETAIVVELDTNNSGLKNQISYYVYELINDEETVNIIYLETNVCNFDITGLYLEASDFSTYRVKVKAVNIYGGESDFTEETPITTDGYGTWLLQAPNVYVRVSDRTISLVLSQHARSDNKKEYGTIRYRVQVRKPGVDESATWFKPATSSDPKASEANYKDGTGYVTCDSVYIQTMPLTGQDSNNIIDTLYQFRIIAYNEAGTSDATVANAIALCTSIEDIVKANENYKELYVGSLSAISANLGVIKKGSLNGSDTNFWALSDVTDDLGVHHYEGEFRVGNEEKYIKVEAVEFDETGKPTQYKVTFATDNFEVLTESTSFNKEIIIYNAQTKLDRVRITPSAIYLEHRDTSAGAWEVINTFDVSGLNAPSYKAKTQIQIGNFLQTQARSNGHDIGRQYLSNDAKVWHFDDNFYCQNGVSGGLTLSGVYALKERGDSNGIDFTPAIQAVAPYCTTAKCLYGQYDAKYTAENVTTLTVDYWIQYLYAEAQELCNIGTLDDKIIMQVRPAEPVAVVSGVVSWRGEQTIIYTADRNPSVSDYAYDTAALAEEGGESNKTISAITQNEDYTVATITVNGEVFTFESGNADANWETFAPQTEWGATSAIAVRADNKRTIIEHRGQAASEKIDLSSLDKEMDEYNWYHIGIVFTSEKIKFLFDDTYYEFTRYATASADMDVTLNGDKTSIIIDELYIDTAVELTADFIALTAKPIPWASLSKDDDWFIFDAKDVTKVKSNILDYFKQQIIESSELRAKVLEITGE